MTKNKESPKLDATVKATHPGMKHELPKYKKPWPWFAKHFPLGEVGKIWRRKFNQQTQVWELEELEVLIIDKSPNCFYYEDADGQPKGCPWWAIHDYEFETIPDPKDHKPSRNDQRKGEPGHRSEGGDI